MLWIKYREYEDIPYELYYYEWETDKDENGETPLMYWTEYR